MSRPDILVKVYGNLYPVTPATFAAVQEVCRAGCLYDPGEDPPVELCGDLLRISYEGIFFPLDDLLECLSALLPHFSPLVQGKIDYLDMEAWTLTRHSIQGNTLRVTSAPLNHVLDHAGL